MRSVSILLPVWGPGVQFLPEAVASVQAQTHTRWELLIGANACSSAEFAAVQACAAGDPRIRVCNFGDAGGMFPVLNRLAALAQEDVIALIDADDIWLPSKLSLQLPFLATADVVGTDGEYFGDRTGSPQIPGGWIAPGTFLWTNPVLHSSALVWKRDAVWSESDAGIGDYELWLRLAAAGRRFVNVRDVLIRHRVHAASAYNTRTFDLAELRARFEARIRAAAGGWTPGGSLAGTCRPRVLVGALSGQAMTVRRDRCRASWMADVRRHGWDAVFLMGGGAASTALPCRQGDELHLPCPDAYETLPQRTAWFCRWALEQSGWEYLFKCDDDTLVCVDRLAALVHSFAGQDYVGRDIGGWASGGAGYFLSRKAAAIVAERLRAPVGNEDQLVGWTLRDAGISLHNEPRLMPWLKAGPDLPSSLNDTITAHGINGDMWADSYRSIQTELPAMRIVMPTSNRHAELAAVSLELLDRYWPGHPPVDVVHHENAAPTARAERQFYAGPQADVPWTDALRKYLSTACPAEFVLLLLDDYALCGEPDLNQIGRAQHVLSTSRDVSAVYLTWMQLPSRIEAPIVDGLGGLLRYPAWTYTVHLQAGLWRRTELLEIANAVPHRGPEAFEIEGSKFAAERGKTLLGFDLPDPLNPSLFLDSVDKTHWPIPYHNLARRGQLDARHAQFLQAAGFDFHNLAEGMK